MTLTAADFAAYYHAVHGFEPFPWQLRLVTQVLDPSENGGWPDVLAVPTGCGKTSALDVALFALAAQPTRFPRRIVMVIDRRVVVDQAYEHGKRIGEALTSPTSAVLQQVTEKLLALWNGKPGQSPVECAVLRGGMPREDAWAQRPDRPVLALSTVDQVGSRLLFRGYGVSPKMASVHAGLLGHDTLFLLDEVHLAVPFAETLLALRGRWRGFYPGNRDAANVLPTARDLPDRWGVVRLSATPGLRHPQDRPPFALPAGGADDEHPRLKPRLQARKPASLREIAVKGKDEDAKRATFASGCAKAALELLGVDDLLAGRPRTLGVIVNRVATAREVAVLLEAEAKERFDVYLLTGRMRPLDRDAVLKVLQPRIKAGRNRNASIRPLIVVATQCIEAGADFDFDALVTECASFDALRQRFGRLDRLGERHGESHNSPALILARSDQLPASADPDPVYGKALKATWDWLRQLGESCDFGIRHLPDPTEEALPTLIAPPTHAPILLPAQLDAWNQTHPRPEPDPDIALWLHGPQRGEPEIQMVWRADIGEASLQDAQTKTPNGDATLEDLIARLAACPPSGEEALALPLSAARRWLKQQAALALADAAMQESDDKEDRPDKRSRERPALVWNGDESFVLIDSDKNLRPGMTLVVPTSYGGIARSNWDPTAHRPVYDYGDIVQLPRRATLRLGLETLPEGWRSPAPPKAGENETAQEVRQKVLEWLHALPADVPEPWKKIHAALGRNPRIVGFENDSLILIARNAARESVSTEDDGASFTGRGNPTTLASHSKHVWTWAEGFVGRLGLPDAVGQDLVLAAWLHDAGKADPRFQKWLVGGSAVQLAMLDAPLAKSAQTLRDRRASEQARRQAGYPGGYRHELLSVAMLAGNESLLASANDRELVLHLVGAHHGWCRPFAPFVDDREDFAVQVMMTDGPDGRSEVLSASTRHRLARLDSGVTERFWNLTERYGWWGLAWLEAILRLADHRASALGRGENDE